MLGIDKADKTLDELTGTVTADTTGDRRDLTAGGGRHHGLDHRTLTPTVRPPASLSVVAWTAGHRSVSTARAICSMHHSGSRSARSSPNRSTSGGRRDAPACVVVGDRRRSRGPATPASAAQVGDAADHLALEALLVEVALAGDRRGRRRRAGRARSSSSATSSNPGTSRPPSAASPPASPPAAPPPGIVATSTPNSLAVHAGRAARAGASSSCDLRRRGALLRAEHRGRVDERVRHVAGDEQLDAAQPRRARGSPAARRARRRSSPTRRARR